MLVQPEHFAVYYSRPWRTNAARWGIQL